MPVKINAQSNLITMPGASIDLTGVTIEAANGITLTDANSQITITPAQATAFNSGTVTLNGGALLVTDGGDLSSENLSNVTLTLDEATTLPDSNGDLPLSINADSNAITANNTLSLSSITVTNYGNLTVASSKTLTLTSTQANQFAGTL